MKQALIKIFLVFGFIFGFAISSYPLSIYQSPPVYVPIDSLKKEYWHYPVNPDFKEDAFTCTIEGKALYFKIKSERQPYFLSLSAPLDEKTEIHFGFDNLVSYTEDSIYIAAHYQKFSIEKGYNTGKYTKIPSVSICKTDLLGLQLLNYPEGITTVQSQLIAGYAITPKYKDETQMTNHSIELGWTRITNTYRNLFTSSYYLSNEFVFNSDNFFIGPKIGAQVSFLMFGLGNELVYYTDFQESSLQWVPYVYVGVANYKLHLDGRIPFYNKGFQKMNNITVGFSMPLIPLTKRKIKW